MPTHVDAAPTKQFFVRMLTRDIDLLEAILDLLDNCVDGITRTNKGKEGVDPAQPYASYYARITASEKKFVIKDNCGGIPERIAEKVAFRLGRPTDHEIMALGLPVAKEGTVGVYGIGMKRAIFKMGRRAKVRSQHNGNAYQVEITPEWLDSGDWNLSMDSVPHTQVKGTCIEVTDLNRETARQFSGETTFLTDLYDQIAELYAVIITKGFVIHLNNKTVKPITLKLLMDEVTETKSITPYVFSGNIRGVSVDIVVGFHRDPSSLSDDPEEDEDRSEAVRQAGWSVVCNDRLVVYGDKTIMTGWGSKPVPRFHPQYNAIAGVVTLRSEDPELLPLNTKKRGIDASLGVYLKVLDYMKAGVKRFTDYTNKWKGRLQETAPQFRKATQRPATEIPRSIPADKYEKVTPARLAEEGATAEEFKPDLPLPPRDDTMRRISFTKEVMEIREVARAILDDEEADPNDVGEACFDETLRGVRRGRKRT